MGNVVDGCGSDGDGNGGWEEPKQEKKKRRAKAKKNKKAGSTEDTVSESESKQPQSIKDIRNQKLHERTMDVSGTASDPLKLLQNLSPLFGVGLQHFARRPKRTVAAGCKT